jgi:hypothetical protein
MLGPGRKGIGPLYARCSWSWMVPVDDRKLLSPRPVMHTADCNACNKTSHKRSNRQQRHTHTHTHSHSHSHTHTHTHTHTHQLASERITRTEQQTAVVGHAPLRAVALDVDRAVLTFRTTFLRDDADVRVVAGETLRRLLTQRVVPSPAAVDRCAELVVCRAGDLPRSR